jgi:uncharacterized membrane protein
VSLLLALLPRLVLVLLAALTRALRLLAGGLVAAALLLPVLLLIALLLLIVLIGHRQTSFAEIGSSNVVDMDTSRLHSKFL